MKISFVGCGKLGIPVALAWASRGHDVVGYDVLPFAKNVFATRFYPHQEADVNDLLKSTSMRIVDSVAEVVAHGDIVFVAVQTPHGPEYEGTTRMPEERSDFDYRALKSAASAVADEAERQRKHVVMVVISTVLPGTSAREVLPLLNSYVSYVYQPMFIAMTQVVPDALKPEFVLLGVDEADARAIELVKSFFETLHSPSKLRFMRVASAELCKVSYNVALSKKIEIANAIMEVAHKTGADCDEVTGALALATDRVVSPKYLRGGMVDAGPCHPRDVIALSWLAERLDLSHDVFGTMVRAREAQCEWIAELCVVEARALRLPVAVLGKAYKRGTNLTIGSAATLLKNMLADLDVEARQWDPYVDGELSMTDQLFREPHAYVVATDHDEFFDVIVPRGSVVIDPWGKFRDQDGVKVVRVGRK